MNPNQDRLDFMITALIKNLERGTVTKSGDKNLMRVSVKSREPAFSDFFLTSELISSHNIVNLSLCKKTGSRSLLSKDGFHFSVTSEKERETKLVRYHKDAQRLIEEIRRIYEDKGDWDTALRSFEL